MVKCLVSLGADIHCSDLFDGHLVQESPLLFAIINNHLKIVKFLVEGCLSLKLEKGANIHIENGICLAIACEKGHLDLVKYLVSKGAKINHNYKILALASSEGRFSVVKFLVSQGADISLNQYTAFTCACEYGHLDVVKYFISKGVNPQVNDNLGFKVACLKGHLHIVKYLISQGVCPHLEDGVGIKLACQGNHVELIEYFASTCKIPMVLGKRTKSGKVEFVKHLNSLPKK